MDDPANFDWSIDSLKKTPNPSLKITYPTKRKETWSERILRMLHVIDCTVKQCTMCHLGRQPCDEHNTIFDPHVFSNLSPSKFMVCGQNPGFNECLQGAPFVGDAGKFFDRHITKNGLSRKDFYISNTVRCHTVGNSTPTHENVSSCEPILRMELMLLKPKLVITLGAVAFGVFCPDKKMSDYLGKIVKSEKFNVKVYPIYHPSPRNMSLESRKKKFIEDINLLCRLIKAYKAKDSPA